MGGAAGRRKAPAAPPVNNFAAATPDAAAPAGFGWSFGFICAIRFLGLPAPAGQVCERQVALNDFELIDRPPDGA